MSDSMMNDAAEQAAAQVDDPSIDATSSACDAACEPSSDAQASGEAASEESNADTNDEIYEAEVLDPELEAELEEALDGVQEDESNDSGDPLEAAQAEVREWKDKYLRLHAEWDTYRRRTNEQRSQEKIRATEKLMGDAIPVLDDFDRTVAYAQEHGENGLLDGVIAVSNKLLDVLKKHGLEVIDPQGEAYDALQAQAIGTVEDTSVPDETVAEVFQRGYKMGVKVLRPAMVTITSGGPARVNEEASEAEDANDA